MQLFLLACAGGAIGAGMRQLVNVAAISTLGIAFPWATLTVNVAGSAIMGAFIALILVRMPEAAGVRMFFATGILGGFTTFSAFSMDTIALVERGAHTSAAIYIIASLVGSIGACAAGYATMRAGMT